MWSYFKITMWANIWLVLWLFFFFFNRKERDNCLSWAMKKYDSDGGYLVIRWARSSRWKYLKWPHFLWLEEDKHEHLLHYVPVEDEHTEKIVPHPWFNGRVKNGDEGNDRTDEN